MGMHHLVAKPGTRLHLVIGPRWLDRAEAAERGFFAGVTAIERKVSRKTWRPGAWYSPT
jgi:hypothetical protein